MQVEPLVTIIIPTYNSADYIAEALDSVFAQTYKNIEVIVIDDNSTDSTPEIVKDYDCKYIRQSENQGPAVARNIGIQNAGGEYVAFLDADDIWFANKLFEQMNVFRIHPELALVTTDAEEYVNGKSTGNTLLSGRKLDTSFREMVKRNLVITSSAVVRRDISKIVGGFEESLKTHEDYVLWLKIVHDYPFYIINKPLLYYRIHKDSLSNISPEVDYKREILVVKMIEQSIRLSILEKLQVRVKWVRKCLSRIFLTLGLIRYYNFFDRIVSRLT